MINQESVKLPMMTAEQEFQLMDRILNGDSACYRELVNQYKRYAFTIAMRVLGNREEAEEASQDAFIKAFHHLKDFNRQSKFSTWLYRIVFNTAITYKRKAKVTFQSIETVSAVKEHASTSDLERADKERYIQIALSRLNDVDRTAMTLFYLKEFSLEEMGQIMGMDANTLKVRIHRARIKMADELKNILKQEALTL